MKARFDKITEKFNLVKAISENNKEANMDEEPPKSECNTPMHNTKIVTDQKNNKESNFNFDIDL